MTNEGSASLHEKLLAHQLDFILLMIDEMEEELNETKRKAKKEVDEVKRKAKEEIEEAEKRAKAAEEETERLRRTLEEQKGKRDIS